MQGMHMRLNGDRFILMLAVVLSYARLQPVPINPYDTLHCTPFCSHSALSTTLFPPPPPINLCLKRPLYL